MSDETGKINFLANAIRRPETKDEWEANASLAEKDLMQEMNEPSFAAAVRVIAKFWAKWYMVAGHKALGRILLKHSN